MSSATVEGCPDSSVVGMSAKHAAGLGGSALVPRRIGFGLEYHTGPFTMDWRYCIPQVALDVTDFRILTSPGRFCRGFQSELVTARRRNFYMKSDQMLTQEMWPVVYRIVRHWATKL